MRHTATLCGYRAVCAHAVDAIGPALPAILPRARVSFTGVTLHICTLWTEAASRKYCRAWRKARRPVPGAHNGQILLDWVGTRIASFFSRAHLLLFTMCWWGCRWEIPRHTYRCYIRTPWRSTCSDLLSHPAAVLLREIMIHREGSPVNKQPASIPRIMCCMYSTTWRGGCN